MRHFMVDPDNEERLLKVPPRVVAAIKAEAYAEAVEAVKAQKPAMWSNPLDAAQRTAVWMDDATAAIESLGEKP